MLEYTDNNLIEQTERLLTVRPRSTAIPVQAGGAGNRGTRARIRVLTTDATRSRNRPDQGFSSRDTADYILSRMVTNNPGFGYSEFLLTDVSVAFNEKVQITQTFGDSEVVYYFGKAPVIYNLSGMLIDDIDNQWFTMFVEAYTHIMRGTELAKNYELIEFTLPNMVVVGSIMSFSYNQSALRDTDITFSIQLHAKEVRPIPIQIPAYPISPNAGLINFSRAEGFTDFTTLSQLNGLKQTVNRIGSVMQGPFFSTSDIVGMHGDLGALLSTNIPKLDTGLLAPATTITAFRASLFSPIYGVLTSITKVVKTVTGDISKIISSFTEPVNTILREIRGVSAQAISVVRLIENSVNDVVNIPLKTLNEVRLTIIALRNTAGVISRAPETISQSIKRLIKFGSLKTSASFLTKGGTKPGSKTALLNSGKPYSAASGASV